MSIWSHTKAQAGAIFVALVLFSAPAWSASLQKSTYSYRPELGAASPQLDVYTVAASKDAPVLVYVHGGAWAVGSRTAVHDKHNHFTGLGFVFVSLDYRLVPKARVDEQLGDIDAALAWVHENIVEFGGDPANLHLMGHSAGAHLVAMTGVAPGPVAKRLINNGALRSVIANDTRAYDIARIAASARGGNLPRLYRRAFGTDPETWQALSPQNRVNDAGKLPAFLLLYSGQGAGNSRDDFANDFADRLRRAGGKAAVFDGSAYSHRDINRGIGVIPELTNAIDSFLGKRS